jgi:DNA polymerase-1
MRKVITRVEECMEAFNDFNFKLFALDVETNDSLKQDTLELTAISLYDGEHNYYIDITKDILIYIVSYFNKVVNNGNNTIMFWNSTFDTRVLYKYGISLEDSKWADIQVFHHLLYEDIKANGLKDITKEFLNYKVVKLDDISLPHNISNPQFVEYTLNDTVFTYELGQFFRPQIKEQGLMQLYKDIEEPFLKVLMHMEINGILVDKQKVEDTTKDLIKLKKNLEIEMYTILGIRYELQANLLTGDVDVVCGLNLNSSQVLQKILFEELKLEVFETSKKTGKASTGKATIVKLKSSHEFVELLDKYRKVQKLLSAFYEPLPDHIQLDGRVRPSYRDTGTTTGRLSCSNPNIQQLPKDNKELGINVRSCFIATPGYKMISCDYSGQELRVLAEVTQDMGLIDAFNSGKDFHQETADKFGITRNKAKAINFGVAYRKQAYGFAKDWGCSEEEAQEFLDRYFQQFPDVKKTMEDTDNFLKRNGYVVSMFNRRRRFKKSTDGKNFYYLRKDMREAFNFLVQSPSADMIRMAAVATYKLGQDNPVWDLKIISTIHDELNFEVKEQYAEESKNKIKECFANIVKFKVPMVSDANVGNNMGELK